MKLKKGQPAKSLAKKPLTMFLAFFLSPIIFSVIVRIFILFIFTRGKVFQSEIS